VQFLDRPIRAALRAILLFTTLISMEHPCHKCRQPVEDGVAFCQQCGAPQIRVAMPEAAALPADLAEGSGLSGPDGLRIPQATAESASAILWPRAVPACAFAALIAAAVMALGLMAPFLAVAGAGFLAVVFYRRRNPGAAVGTGAGARLGAMSGLLCFAMFSIVEAAGAALFHTGPQVRQKMLEAIQQAGSRTSDPQAQAMLDYFKGPTGFPIMLVMAAIFAFLAFLVLSSLGGALGGAALGRRSRT
jgi:uncharacterized membrane protein YphA (DoxX/SURF4 family)